MNLLKSRFHEDLSDIVHQVKKQAENEFLLQHVDIPSIPFMRMQILFLFLLDCGVPMDRIKGCIIPTILVQMALDCHEEVPNHFTNEPEESLKRQLSVLAGDFYSSKYYYLLSNVQDIDLIRDLALSIRSINELKTQIYCSPDLDAEQYLMAINKIDSSLYTGFIQRFQRDRDKPWITLFHQFILVERLMDEWMGYKWNSLVKGYLSRLINHCALPEALEMIRDKLENLLDSIMATLHVTTNREVREELELLAKEYLFRLSNNSKGLTQERDWYE